MIVIVIIIFICLMVLVKGKIHDSISSLFAWVFLLYWGVSLVISSFNPYNLYEVSNYAIFLLLLNVISFITGFLVVKEKVSAEISKIDIQNIVSSKLFKIVLLIGISLVFSLFFAKQRIMQYYDYETALFRADFFEILFEGNALLLYGYYMFLFPLYYFLISVVCYCLFFYRKWWIIIGSLLYLLPFMSLNEGRMHYMGFALILLFDFFLYRSNRSKVFRTPRKVKYFSVLGFVALYLFMAHATANRLDKDSLLDGVSELNKSFIIYSISPFRAFDYAINNNYVELAGGYQYGLASICGFDYVISTLLKKIGIEYTSSRTITNSYLQNNSVVVGPDQEINYAFTNAIYHYYDFGALGIVIMPFIFGCICRSTIMRFSHEGTFYLHAACTFLFFIMSHMVFSWYFNKLFTIPYLLFLFYKCRNINRKLLVR